MLSLSFLIYIRLLLISNDIIISDREESLLEIVNVRRQIEKRRESFGTIEMCDRKQNKFTWENCRKKILKVF
jgi:hypothetical protein